jgi:hypothetical protein
MCIPPPRRNRPGYAILLEHGTMVECYGAVTRVKARALMAEWKRRQRKPGSPLARAIGLVRFHKGV